MGCQFTIDWEPWFALYPYGQFWEENDPLIEEPTNYLLDLLRRHRIKATWYCVGWLVEKQKSLLLKILSEGHKIGDHTYYHSTDLTKKDLPLEIYRYGQPITFSYRAPRWKGQKRLYSGGFWLRAMPYWWLKREVEKEGTFFIHPHDIMLEHPDCGNPYQNFKRQIGLKTSRDKLERLCREVTWNEPV